MSSTRRSSRKGPLRQERFSSSGSLSRGLLGNLVAKRCETIIDPRQRTLIYFLHELSLRDGYTLHPSCNLFAPWPWSSTVDYFESAFRRLARELTEFFPERIGAKGRERFIQAAPQFFTKLCLDPSVTLATARTVFFSDIVSALFEYKARFEAAITPRIADTAAARIIAESLDYALSQRGMVLVEGAYRVGKSYAAQGWALQHLGQCRYVPLSSSTDDTAFYRDIARALGVACGLKMKAAELRHRIEEAVRGQHLLLIFDEADYLWPQSINLKASPNRVNWLMTALVNNGVPVALIGSRNFSRMLAHVERRCPIWGSEQFHGRIKLRRALPDSLEPVDLEAIAALLLPDGSKSARLLLVSHALRSEGYVAALESGALRARFFAGQEGRAVAYEDVQRMMKESGTHQPGAAKLPRKKNSPDKPAKVSRTPRGLPASDRLPLGSLAGVENFTGTRPPGFFP